MTSESNLHSTGAGNPGETLREARERSGMSLGSVARQLNLSERSLEHVEAGNFAALPGHTFTRGYIRSYAKLLGLDPQRLVLDFDRFTGTDAAGSQVHSLSRIEEPVRLASVGLKVISFVVLLVLGASAFFLWQERAALSDLGEVASSLGSIEVDGADGTTQVHSFDEPEDMAVLQNQAETATPATDAAPPQSVEASARALPAGGPQESSTAQPDANAADETAARGSAVVPDTSSQVPRASETSVVESTSPVTTAPAPAAASAASVAAPDAVTPTAPTEAASPAAPISASETLEPSSLAGGGSTLEMRFAAECWTRVTDAQDRVLLNALVPAGATRRVEGQPPLSVVLGYSRGVEVIFNGVAVDIAPYRRGETARFKLGQ